jgi:hypothetical protein
MTHSTPSFAVTVCLLFGVAAASAQSQPAHETRAQIFWPFSRGVRELQLGGGLFVSENYFDVLRPQMNDVDVTTRLGWMLSDPVFEGIFRGNFEVVTELFGGGFVKGPADGLMGVTLFLRYNYVQPGARLVPMCMRVAAAFTATPPKRIRSESLAARSFSIYRLALVRALPRA